MCTVRGCSSPHRESDQARGCWECSSCSYSAYCSLLAHSSACSCQQGCVCHCGADTLSELWSVCVRVCAWACACVCDCACVCVRRTALFAWRGFACRVCITSRSIRVGDRGSMACHGFGAALVSVTVDAWRFGVSIALRFLIWFLLLVL